MNFLMYGNANEVSKKNLHAVMQLASLTFSLSLTTLIPSPQKQLHVTSFNILPISSETLFRNLQSRRKKKKTITEDLW